MRIKQIEVTGLFGMFDHVIPLNMEDRITIIYGLNGVGKTATLKLLSFFFNLDFSDFSELENIPFKTVKMKFDNDRFIQVNQKHSDKLSRQETTISFSGENIDISLTNLRLLSHKKNLEKEYKGLIENKEYNLDVSDYLEDLELEIAELQERIKEKKLKEIPDWLDSILNDFNVRFIESQRLFKFSDNVESFRKSINLSVNQCANELSKNIKNKLAEYSQMSQLLDRTFPMRIIQQQEIEKISDENLRIKLSEIEAKRYKLINVGLLDKDEDTDFQIPEKIDETINKFLSVYVEDVEKKLSVFDDLAERIEIFKRIINQRFSYKQINIDKDAGFTFTCNGSPLSPEKLSSGEQHELIILYELLFKVPPNSLILIDEPEISLHVEWQVHFLKDLQEITRISDIDVVIATHSPDIIHDRWDLTVELKGSRNERNTNTESYC
ncbi:MAG TPA: AAA family ATPase [Nostocaceae cyanobacterium]|nr:AAA family ATPase [Nostocaceae cyanobacterium]